MEKGHRELINEIQCNKNLNLPVHITPEILDLSTVGVLFQHMWYPSPTHFPVPKHFINNVMSKFLAWQRYHSAKTQWLAWISSSRRTWGCVSVVMIGQSLWARSCRFIWLECYFFFFFNTCLPPGSYWHQYRCHLISQSFFNEYWLAHNLLLSGIKSQYITSTIHITILLSTVCMRHVMSQVDGITCPNITSLEIIITLVPHVSGPLLS